MDNNKVVFISSYEHYAYIVTHVFAFMIHPMNTVTVINLSGKEHVTTRW